MNYKCHLLYIPQIFFLINNINSVNQEFIKEKFSKLLDLLPDDQSKKEVILELENYNIEKLDYFINCLESIDNNTIKGNFPLIIFLQAIIWPHFFKDIHQTKENYKSSYSFFYLKNTKEKKSYDQRILYQLDKPDLLKKNSDKLKNDLLILIGNYKIHLMPKNWDNFIDQTKWIKKISRILKENQDLYQLIPIFKVKIKSGTSKDTYGNILPKIVIYPATGKENAQLAVNLIYKYLAEEKEDNNETPRFNEKVTNLIFLHNQMEI